MNASSTVLIDIGCAKHGSDESIPHLIEEFHPDALWGFDPSTEDRAYDLDGTAVEEFQRAVWTHEGNVRFTRAGLGGHIDEQGERTRSVDLARLVSRAHDDFERVIVKMDIESGEYELVPYLRATDSDLKISLLLVEWHCACGYGIWNGVHPDVGCPRDFQAWLARRDGFIAQMRCETKEWTL